MILNLFITFFKIGAFTFGGGYAMIPIMEREIVENKKLIGDEEFTDMLALAQASPGPVAVNTSVFIGYKIRGLTGALSCLLGTVLPSFLIILIIAIFFNDFKNLAIVEEIFSGIRPAIAALILSSVVIMLKKGDNLTKRISIAVIVAVLVGFLDISPVIIIIAGALISLIMNYLKIK
ncbi:chromate transporter [Soehngenia longivitae]|uniref:Chromate transporter n=1 Tax=Soehngenia longivitae TaxID=2562294 RepID=A0A4Z0D9H0_9FIRM|nr:chromate transporter [Soehngenia longivitae]